MLKQTGHIPLHFLKLVELERGVTDLEQVAAFDMIARFLLSGFLLQLVILSD